jgi:CheY-like chemotaxis protein
MSAIRFLIVDSSQSLHTFMQQLLTGYGFDADCIQCATDPGAALEVSAELAPDFLLTDWFSKETIDGIALYQAILQRNPDCRFAMLSADASNSNRQVAQEAGAVFLLKKPCTAQELRAALTNAMELLAVESPKMAAHVNAMRSTAAKAQAAVLAAKIPKFEVGEHVQYRGRRESVKYVILRRGELVVQLNGMTGLVPASNVQKFS